MPEASPASYQRGRLSERSLVVTAYSSDLDRYTVLDPIRLGGLSSRHLSDHSRPGSLGGRGMQCPQCQHENPASPKFCPECGTSLRATSEGSLPGASYAELQRDLSEAHEQQTATSEILRVISSSPTDVQPVFETIAASAVRLCRALFSIVSRREGDLIHVAAQNNLGPAALEEIGRSYPMPVDRESITGRTLLDRTVGHVRDVETDPDVPGRGRELARAFGFRTVVSVPMLREGEAIGAIAVARAEAEPFSEQEIVLLQ